MTRSLTAYLHECSGPCDTMVIKIFESLTVECRAWKLAGFDLVSDITEVAKSEYKIDQINEEYLADKDYIQSRLKMINLA